MEQIPSNSKRVSAGPILAVLFALLLGGGLRFSLAAAGDFPLNDGGMFYVMVQELIDNRFALPEFTSYNGGQIPFTYPPLAFYLAALIRQVTRLPLLSLFQYLPAALSALTIPAVYWLGLRLTGSQRQAVFAALAFALLPRAFVWPIMGGGLSRAAGLLAAVLALALLVSLFKPRPERWQPGRALLASLACAVTVLTHPEIAWFLCCSALLMIAFWGRSRRGLAHAAAIGALVALFSSPWWGTSLARHGWETFLAPFQVGSQESGAFIRLLLFSYTEETFTDLIGALAFIGLLAELARRRFFLPAWVALIVFLSLRNAPYILMLPVALLAAITLEQLLLPGIERLAGEKAGRARLWAQAGILGFLCFSAVGFVFTPNASLHRLSVNDRAAMAWVQGNTPPLSRFILITSAETWEIDSASEWFPALSGGVSLNTVQGSEWFPGGGYAAVQKSYRQLQACAQSDAACLESWEQQTAQVFQYVYIQVAPRSLPLIQALAASPDYARQYANEGVMIFSRTP
jgi:hypothetical protein